MLAVIQTGGKQYKVEKGSNIEIETLEGKEGDNIEFKQVLLINDGKSIQVGEPLIEGATVKGKIVAHKRGDKIIVFKMKAKKRYQKTQGHRQNITAVEITEIKCSSKKAEVDKVEVAKPEVVKTKAPKKASPKKKED